MGKVKTYTIGGKAFEFDETKKYLDFYLTSGVRNLVDVPFAAVLEALESSASMIGRFTDELMMLDRWVHEANRKRFYRKMVLEGFTVVSGEYWFEDRDDGLAIIDALENSGRLARRILEAFDPSMAFACKQSPHPATVTYIDP